jgi:hypothetical protein
VNERDSEEMTKKDTEVGSRKGTVQINWVLGGRESYSMEG